MLLKIIAPKASKKCPIGEKAPNLVTLSFNIPAHSFSFSPSTYLSDLHMPKLLSLSLSLSERVLKTNVTLWGYF